jgi:hypothetical protein
MTERKDQRAVERFPINTFSSCDFVSPVLEDFGPLRVKNISTDGIGLISSQALEAGLLLAVNLVNPTKDFSKTILVRVVHSTPQPGGTYLIGGIFNTALTYEELCVLVM